MRLAIAALALLLAAPALAEVAVREPVALRAYAAAPTGAVYFVVANDGDQADRLLSVRADEAARAMLHETVTGADGSVGMAPVADGLPVPAQGELRLDPGGRHVMLMGLAPGETVTLTLTFEQAGEVELTLPWQQGAAATGHGSAHAAH